MFAALLAAPSTALAVPKVDGEFPVSATPGHLALGPDGNIWVTLSGAGNKLARVTPAGAVTEYNPANITGLPVGIVAGPDGKMWVTETGKVASFTTTDPNSTTTTVETAVAEITRANGIVSGPQGSLWTASGDKLIKITPGAPPTTSALPITNMDAREIAAGTDGRLWIADFGSNRIVSAATDGTAVFHATGGLPQGVGAGPGGQVVYSNPGTSPQTIGRLTLNATPLTTPTPTSDPFGIVFGSDGAYWIANFAKNELGRLTTDGTYTELPGFTAGPRYITAGPGNTLWVSLELANKIGRVTGVDPVPAGGGGGGGGGGGTGGGGTGGGGGGGTKDTAAPVVSRLSLGSAFRVGSEPTQLVGTAAKTGTTIRFTLSEDALARMLVQRVTTGRRKGGSCVKPTSAPPGAKRCRRYVALGTMTRASKKGANRVRFTGRLGDKALEPGRYRLEVTAVDAARNKSKPVRRGFRILAAAKKRAS